MKRLNDMALLLNPPGGYYATKTGAVLPPLGLCYLAAPLVEKGIPVEILDLDIHKDAAKRFEKHLLQKAPSVIGVSFTTKTRFIGFDMIRRAKRVLPDAMVVAGGPHVTLASDDTLTNIPELDVIVRGEGDDVFADFCEAFISGGDWTETQAISYRDGGVKHNPRSSFVADLDSLLPARELLNMEAYLEPIDIGFGLGAKRSATIMTSRGCPFSCSFCSVTQHWGRKWRARSAENVLHELEKLVADYEITAFRICDDTFTVDTKRAAAICEGIISKGWNLNWMADIRVDNMDKELLALMARSGCYSVSYGVESGVQARVDDLQKKIDLDKVRLVDKWCKEVGIEGIALFIISLPDETYEEAKTTIEFVNSLEGDSSMNILMVFPGTQVETIARERGIIAPDFSWSAPMPKGKTLPGVIENVPVYIENLSYKEIGELIFRWVSQQKRFNVWERIPRALKNVRSLGDIRNLANIGMGAIRWRRRLQKRESP